MRTGMSCLRTGMSCLPPWPTSVCLFQDNSHSAHAANTHTHTHTHTHTQPTRACCEHISSHASVARLLTRIRRSLDICLLTRIRTPLYKSLRMSLYTHSRCMLTVTAFFVLFFLARMRRDAELARERERGPERRVGQRGGGAQAVANSSLGVCVCVCVCV
jgi:hypothetical protein